MKIIAAYPCLGKTTLYRFNKDKCLDREFYESRSILGMTPEQQDAFFDHCAAIVRLQYQADYYKVLFITEDERLLSRLTDLKQDIILVFPDYSPESFAAYKERVIQRSGEAWFNRVIGPEFRDLGIRLDRYRKEGWDLRLTNMEHSFIQDVVDLPKDFILPGTDDTRAVEELAKSGFFQKLYSDFEPK